MFRPNMWTSSGLANTKVRYIEIIKLNYKKYQFRCTGVITALFGYDLTVFNF
jgi:hypothetical protein